MSTAARPRILSIEEREGELLVIVLDREDSKVNLIDERWIEEMTRAVERAEREKPQGFVLLSGKPGNFIAGADVSLIASLADSFEAASKARVGQELLSRIEDLPCRTVCAINGACLGGGLETALAFRYRIAADDHSIAIGLPEVRLGILPGFGGAYRLPRAVGVMQALPLVLTGKNLRPRSASRIGLVHRLTAPALLEEVALQAARSGLPLPRRKTSQVLSEFALGRTPVGRSLLKTLARRNVLRETGGHYPAPFEIIERVVGGYGSSRARAMHLEAEAFGRLAVSSVAKNLLFLFQGSESLGRQGPAGLAAREEGPMRRGVVIGAGTMGGAIAGALASRGIEVRMRDVSIEALRVGMANAARPLNRRVEARALEPRERDAILAKISPTTELTGLSRAAFVIEAAPENLELKTRIFRDLEERLPDRAFLATNTSSIPITRIAAALRRPERLVGVHFFNPVDRMPLVEIIPGERTSPHVVRQAVSLIRSLKKSPLVVGDRPGFLVNRVLFPYLNEAALAVGEGWSVERIDRALLRFGMPMGPLAVLDEVGLDVAQKVAAVLEEAFGERAKPAAILARLLEKGALGKKAGRGFWRGTGSTRTPNGTDLGKRGGEEAPEDAAIVERLLTGMINEAARVLGEGVVSDPDHLDLGTVLGCGFPPFRGGIRRFALALGEDEVRARLDRLFKRYGNRFAPAEELHALFRARSELSG
jgi:3-hydroxyacyl-CoA dehydrogenase/enoyl-CoA hydratase/3-hydroxybutyryl-CoA epimerase